MNNSVHDNVLKLYQTLIDAWNNRDAKKMAEQFTEQGVQIGFDGSKVIGQEEIFSHLTPPSLRIILLPPLLLLRLRI